MKPSAILLLISAVSAIELTQMESQESPAAEACEGFACFLDLNRNGLTDLEEARQEAERIAAEAQAALEAA